MMISLTYSRASSGRDLSMMIKFLSLVTNDEWRSLDEWAFQEGHSQLGKGATGFLYLIHSKGLKSMTEGQIRDGFDLLVRATKLGFKLSPATVGELRRKGIILQPTI